MLTELTIENFAIIQSLHLEFKRGLVVFTGETGAGKSIILDALEAVLGGRTDVSAIRSGAERASVEAVFKLDEAVKPAVHELLKQEELLDDPDYITLAREIRAGGRTVMRVNGSVVNISLAREVGACLVDIHGQSEHLSLLKVRQHLELLDRFAATAALKADYRKTYDEIRLISKELTQLRQAEQDAARRVDMLTYQIQEIEDAKLQPNEEEELRLERTRLSNAENLSGACQQALLLLDEGTTEVTAITDLLGQVIEALANLSRIDPETQSIFERADGALATLSDLSLELRDYAENIEFNPRRLNFLEERIDLMNNLKRKYGSTLSEVLAFAEKARGELDTITHASERIEELTARQNEVLTILAQKAQVLSDQRQQAAAALSQAIEQQLDDLKMASARFQVAFEVDPDEAGLPLTDGRLVAFDASGFDRVEFLIEPNPGEGFKPLVKIASGGETARLMLALKNVLAGADTIATLIFDEIDQGIGGRVGMIVGEKLWQLSGQHQVLCITHLPQLAAYGDQHYHVAKEVSDGRTLTQVHQLAGDIRQHELAQMLGAVSDGTLQSAAELLALVAAYKQQHQTKQ